MNIEKKPPKLLDQVRQRMAKKKLSQSTQLLYISWMKRYILFHKKVHPINLGMEDISSFLNHLAVELNLSHSSQTSIRKYFFLI